MGASIQLRQNRRLVSSQCDRYISRIPSPFSGIVSCCQGHLQGVVLWPLWSRPTANP